MTFVDTETDLNSNFLFFGLKFWSNCFSNKNGEFIYGEFIYELFLSDIVRYVEPENKVALLMTHRACCVWFSQAKLVSGLNLGAGSTPHTRSASALPRES